jgi:hypothetical protein
MLSFGKFTTRSFLVVLIFIYVIIDSFLFFMKFIILATFWGVTFLAMC